MRRRSLLRDESGFSLMELMTAMAIGSVVLTIVMTVFTNGVTGSARVGDRVEAAQRGRLALDRITSLLDSQVCNLTHDAPSNTDISVPPVLANSDDNSITFYADLSGASDTPTKYTLTYSAAAKTLTEYDYAGSGKLPYVAYPNTPTRTRVLATNVWPARQGGVMTGAQLPIFRYYRFLNSAIDPAPRTTPLSATDAPTIVRVDVQFKTVPERTKTEDARSASLSGQGTVLTANPTTNTVC
jgi:prepilin-type N-terminal cleavage/methylation domain-containing protein